MDASLPVFLTAYDPAELPGGTVDPLGFTAGYLALADLLFPGMTAAAGQATYFPMLCAGLGIAEAEGGLRSLSAAAARKGRIDVALRFERLWALACALQLDSPEATEDELAAQDRSKVNGVRGIRYVEREVERLRQQGSSQANTLFALLAQQYRYGVFGIYGGVAEQLGLLEKATFATTPEFGDRIGEGFLAMTTDSSQRKALLRAALDEKASIPVSTLRAWGARAHPGAALDGQARELLREAIAHDPQRARMLKLLEGVARDWQGEWTDRLWLGACAKATSETEAPDLLRTLQTALAYDAFLRLVTLIFERIVWLCRKNGDAEKLSVIFDDAVLLEASRALSDVAGGLVAAERRLRELGKSDLFARGRGVLPLAQGFASGGEVSALVRGVLKRHAQIQSAKVEQGRPKQAWIEERNGELALTGTRVGERLGEPRTAEGSRAPDWRFGAALSMLEVTGRLTWKAAT